MANKYGTTRWRFRDTGIIGRELVERCGSGITIGGYGWNKTFSKWFYLERVADKIADNDPRECTLGMECNPDGSRRTP
jgi:hypothetical protein